MSAAGKTFGIVGALAAFPRRLAAREVERQGGQLRRGAARRTTHAVFGRRLLERAGEAEICAKVEAARAAGRALLSENAFLRLLGVKQPATAGDLPAEALIEQARLDERDFALLCLFDCFEHAGPPFGFRDLILARKYAGLIAGGAGWLAIARSVHRSGEVTSLTALSLHVEGEAEILARLGDTVCQLDGQMLLPIERAEAFEAEEHFALAEAYEAAGRHAEAAALYQRCLAADPADSVAAFNRANCLRADGRLDEAAHDYQRALKLDPGFAEAWFNFAGLAAERGQPDAALRHLRQALSIDPGYADAVYNLARLSYEEGDLPEARRWWVRYLELDQTSDWARRAARGIQFVDLALAQRTAG